MKKKLLTLCILAVVVALAGCAKDRQCKCVTTDVPDDGKPKILVVDAAMRCSDITQMGFEEKYVDTTDITHPSHSLRRTEVHQVSCRDYNEKD